MELEFEEEYILYAYDERLDKHVKVAKFNSLEEIKKYKKDIYNSISTVDFNKTFVRHIKYKIERTIVEENTIYDFE